MSRQGMAASFEDIASVASLIASVFAIILVAATLARASPTLVGSRRGWILVACGLALFAVRVLGHFTTNGQLELARGLLGIAGSLVLAWGFLLIHLDARRTSHVA